LQQSGVETTAFEDFHQQFAGIPLIFYNQRFPFHDFLPRSPT
jgi:hypothetical protein